MSSTHLKKSALLAVLCCSCILPHATAQENIATVGFQYRPIIPSAFFNVKPQTVSLNGIDYTVSPKTSYSAGMIIRRGYTKRFTLETGINYTKRNFGLTITDTTFTGNTGFTIVGYEIPLQLLVFQKFSEYIFMNAGFGFSVDMYASDVQTRDTYFFHKSYRHGVFQLAALANLGVEYRTKKNGYFYIGSSYHLPSDYIYGTVIRYEPLQQIGRMKLSGNYLTLDFRYYFHEEPLKPRKKKKKEQ